jgi:hypothetical protein
MYCKKIKINKYGTSMALLWHFYVTLNIAKTLENTRIWHMWHIK